MGQDIQAGHYYTDTESGRDVTAENLNAHVNGAVIKETFLSGKPVKATPQLSDIFLLSDGVLRKTTFEALRKLFIYTAFLSADEDGLALMADGFFPADDEGRAKFAEGFVNELLFSPDAVHEQEELDALADADEFLIYDASSTSLRRIKKEDILLQLMPVGSIVQTVFASSTVYGASSATIPLNNTIPQATQGTQILTASITPKASSHKVLIEVTVHIAPAVTQSAVAALFRGAAANALAAGVAGGINDTNGVTSITFHFVDSPASESAQTYNIRVGAGSGNIYINGIAAGQRYGGALACQITLKEIKA